MRPAPVPLFAVAVKADPTPIGPCCFCDQAPQQELGDLSLKRNMPIRPATMSHCGRLPELRPSQPGLAAGSGARLWVS